jgi:hypothetical protein
MLACSGFRQELKNQDEDKMGNKITGAEYPLAEIFSSKFDYTIPAYQRPYAWTVDETSELFDDLHGFYEREKDAPYFLGSIVLIKEEDKPLAEVIDGQQRLTTLTILLACIASNLSDRSQKTDYENYINEPGRSSQGLQPKPRLSLRVRDKKFFSFYVQSLNLTNLLALDPATLDNESQRNIQSNSRLLLTKLDTSFGKDINKLCVFGAFLVQRCFLVAVSTSSQQSAFRVFSVLNNRGLDLLPSDIIKADVIGKVSAANQEDYTDKWEELEVHTGRSGFNDLFGHIRMIYAREKAKRALLDEFQEHVLAKTTPEDLIDNILEPYAESYLIVKNQSYISTSNANDINLLLKWLNRIDNADWIPPAILFLSQNKDNPEYTLWFFTKLERIAAYCHICAKNINERIERYSQIISSLNSPHSLDNTPISMELTNNEIEEFLYALDGKIYELTARRRNYLILRLDSFFSDGAATYDPNLLTIEHVLPQTVSAGSEWETTWPDQEERKKWVHRIANLVPLTQRRNSQAQNFDFTTKKLAYFGGKRGVSSYILTTQVLQKEQWTLPIIIQRQQELLDVLIERWELTKTSV